MQTITQIIVSFLGIIGISGIITVLLNKSKEIEFQKLQNKEKRYKCTILLMEACLDLEKLKHIEGFRDELKTKADVIGGLTFEYNQMLLYSSKEIITAIKKFINSLCREDFYKTLIVMRKDLWIKRRDLDLKDIQL